MNYIVARVGQYSRSKIRAIQNHNDRKRSAYKNPDIVIERSHLNKELIEGFDGKVYTKTFDKWIEDKKISTSGLKKDAVIFNEILHDVNSEYWLSYKDYGYASAEEMADAYFKECLEFDKQKYGADKIISAKIHKDEINRELSKKHGFDVWHYHMHVIAVPTVVKEKKWTKRCKNPELIGKVKERITQVSDSKFWAWKKDEEKSFSQFQTDIAEHLQKNFDPKLMRGEKESNRQHLSVEEFKRLQQELKAMNEKLIEQEKELRELNQKCDGLEVMKSRLEYEIFEKEEEITKLNNTISESSSELKKTTSELSETKNKLVGAQKHLKATEGEFERLKEEFRISIADIAKIKIEEPDSNDLSKMEFINMCLQRIPGYLDYVARISKAEYDEYKYLQRKEREAKIREAGENLSLELKMTIANKRIVTPTINSKVIEKTRQ